MIPLALPYTPHHLRDIRPAHHRGIFHVDCHEEDGDDYRILIHRAFVSGKPHLPPEPIIYVSTARTEDYVNDSFEPHETVIRFRDRAGFRVGYRLARVLRKEDGSGWIMRRDMGSLLEIELAEKHSIVVIDGWYVFETGAAVGAPTRFLSQLGRAHS